VRVLKKKSTTMVGSDAFKRMAGLMVVSGKFGLRRSLNLTFVMRKVVFVG
jgi:hypothetical protein